MKEIRALSDFTTPCGLAFKKGERFIAEVLQVGFCGALDRLPQYGIPEGCIYPAAIVRFRSGKIICLDIENHVCIACDAGPGCRGLGEVYK